MVWDSAYHYIVISVVLTAFTGCITVKKNAIFITHQTILAAHLVITSTLLMYIELQQWIDCESIIKLVVQYFVNCLIGLSSFSVKNIQILWLQFLKGEYVVASLLSMTINWISVSCGQNKKLRSSSRALGNTD